MNFNAGGDSMKDNDVFFHKFSIIFSFLFIFIFFFVIEWRWQAVLIGMYDIKPLVLAATLSSMVMFITILGGKRGIMLFWGIVALILYWVILSILNTHELQGLSLYELKKEIGVWSINVALFIVYKKKKVWKDDVKQNYIEYENSGHTYKMWIEDEESMRAKLSLIVVKKQNFVTKLSRKTL